MPPRNTRDNCTMYVASGEVHSSGRDRSRKTPLFKKKRHHLFYLRLIGPSVRRYRLLDRRGTVFVNRQPELRRAQKRDPPRVSQKNGAPDVTREKYRLHGAYVRRGCFYGFP